MDFYTRQAAARSHTRWLVVAFLLCLLAVALALDVVLFAFVSSNRYDNGPFSLLDYATQNPGPVIFTTAVIMGVLGLASLYKTLELRGGGGVVAVSLGGVRVTPDTADLKRKRLYNVVEEMAIASGVPMPEIYVLEQESAINAFAAGHTPANAAVTVTQGALDHLTRDELQGVIGHEFSHILNGDMRLNIELMGWVFGLFVVALIGRTIVQIAPRDDRRRGGNGLAALGFAVMVLGYVGLFAGRILQAAVSRQRERLADASGVQFTRNPQGLRDALVKIAALPEGSRLAAVDAEQAAHMLFAEGLSRVFATHPPILERIRELDPQFDPRELDRVRVQLAQNQTEPDPANGGAIGAASGTAGGGAVGFATGAMGGGGVGVASGAMGGGAVGVTSRAADGGAVRLGGAALGAIASQVGRPGTAHILHAQALRMALPESLRGFTESPGRAQALVLALLISADEAVRERQLARLASSIGAANVSAVQQILPLAQSLAPMLRLPALQQLFPALRRATPAQRKALAQLASDLIEADGQIEVFEFCLAKLLETLLTDELQARPAHGVLSLESAQPEIALLFATLAQLGTAATGSGSVDPERLARRAYEAGMSVLFPMRRPSYAPVQDWPSRLSQALSRLEQLHPYAKKALIEGLVNTISNDNVLTEAEAELLRTVCAVLHCPLPPLLPEVA